MKYIKLLYYIKKFHFSLNIWEKTKNALTTLYSEINSEEISK